MELGYKLLGNELGISIYRQFFEVDFIKETHEYYRSLGRNWLTHNSFPDYMKKVFSFHIQIIRILRWSYV